MHYLIKYNTYIDDTSFNSKVLAMFEKEPTQDDVFVCINNLELASLGKRVQNQLIFNSGQMAISDVSCISIPQEHYDILKLYLVEAVALRPYGG